MCLSYRIITVLGKNSFKPFNANTCFLYLQQAIDPFLSLSAGFENPPVHCFWQKVKIWHLAENPAPADLLVTAERIVPRRKGQEENPVWL